MKIHGCLSSVLTATGMCCYSAMAGAAGYQIQEQSVKGLGNAFAGGGAIAEDASTALYNPAGLTRLNSSQAEFGVHIIFPQADFKNAGSTNGIGAPAVGGEDDGGEPAVVPNLFYAQPVNDNLTFGFAVSSLYGLVTEYDRNWIGRYHAVKSDLLTLTINPSIGYRINQQLSFGVGVSAQYADAKLTNALDFGTLGFLAGAPVTPSTPAFDGFTKVEGDDWGFGFNAGMLYELDENTRIGLSFRSKVEHTLKGDNRLTIPDFAVALAGPSRTRGVQTSVTIPATLSLSGYHQIDQHWAVMADVTWTDWSVFDELRLEFDDGSADAVQPEEWDDAYRFSLGASYRYNDAWTLRAGVAYDQSPVPGADRRTPRIPDDSRTWVTVGASYRLSEAFSFDVAYAHIFIGEVPIRDTEVTTGALANGAPVGSTLDGEFDASVDILSAQIQWKF